MERAPRPAVEPPNPGETEDIYAAQREELLERLKSCLARHRPLEALGRTLLLPDDIASLLQKIRHRHPFSRKERNALVEAGFAVDKLYPLL